MENSSDTDVLVSFIIPHHGRDQMLIDTVRSIAAQEVDARVEVLVVSKHQQVCFMALKKTLMDIVKNGDVDHFTIPTDKTISFARNSGAARAAGKYLAFIDADVKLAPNWVVEMIRVLRENSSALLCSAVQQADADRTELDLIKSSMSQANAGRVKALPGNALFIEKAVFDAHPKFPEHLETCEDWVFTNTLSFQGEVLLSDQSYVVHLGEDKDFQMLFRKEIWRGSSNLHSIKGRRVEPAEWLSFIVPVVVGGGLVLAVLCLLVGQFLLSGLMLLLTLVAPALYSIRLKIKASVPVGLPKIICFYLVYFSARAVGMFKGLLSGILSRESVR